MARWFAAALLLSFAGCEQPASTEGVSSAVAAAQPPPGSVVPNANPSAESPPEPGSAAPVGAGGEPDCSQLCKLSGGCVVDNGRCIPTAEEHCKDSQNCVQMGLCTLVGNACQVPASTPEECNREHGTKKHNPCVDWGRCTPQDGTCVVATDADCQKFRECKRYGYCRAKDGKCVK